MSKKTRVLHILSSLRSGGVAVLLYNYFMNMDKSKITFDFIVHVPDKGFIEQKLDSYDVRVFHLPRFNHLWSTFWKTRKIIKEGNYKIVHVHHTSKSFIQLFAAWSCGVPVRIAHSHEQINWGIPLSLLYRFYGFLTTFFATNCFACSKIAAEYVFGKKRKYQMVYNAINADQYSFDEKKRNSCRDELGLSNQFVLIHVGRFTEPKNHSRLIQIFKEFLNKHKDAILLLVGIGELFDPIKKYVAQEGLSANVRFLGERSDIGNLLNAADYFVFPSKHEGLGIVLIEAQASGLRCVASKDVIPSEVDLFGNISFVSLNESNKQWCEIIFETSNYVRRNYSLELQKYGYDLKYESIKLQDWYLSRADY